MTPTRSTAARHGGHARPVAALLGLPLALVMSMVGPAGPALAAPEPPQLSIRIDDGQASTTSGAGLRYAVTVTNLGPKRVEGLVVSTTVPAGAELGDVEGGGSKRSATVRWTLDVPAGKEVTRNLSVTVADRLPEDLLRLATVACAAPSSKAAPTVCASDSDELPAGAAAATQQRQLEAVSEQGPTGWRSGWAIGAYAVSAALLLAVGAALLRRQKAAPTGRRHAGAGR